MDSAFISTKSALALVPTLVHPDPSGQVSLAVDASDYHVRAVFQQLVQGSWGPLAFCPKKLSSAKTRYSTFDPEVLAAFSAMKHFRFLLEGLSFTLFTDHKPLTFALFRVSPPWSARQQRHLSYLSKFTSDLVHLPGPQNVVADALSCSSSAASFLTVGVIQVPGLNPFGEFLLGLAPSCLFPPLLASVLRLTC